MRVEFKSLTALKQTEKCVWIKNKFTKVLHSKQGNLDNYMSWRLQTEIGALNAVDMGIKYQRLFYSSPLPRPPNSQNRAIVRSLITSD